MFLATRPSSSTIDRFLQVSQDLPVSYGPIGILDNTSHRLDEQEVTIGRGRNDFERARRALSACSTPRLDGSKPSLATRQSSRARWSPCSFDIWASGR